MSRWPVFVTGLTLVVSGCAKEGQGPQSSADGLREVGPNELASPASFAGVSDDSARAEAVFAEMFKVIGHPRCLNCHPVSDSPTQGDEMAVHYPPVERGPDGRGVVGMECSTCHGAENVAFLVSERSLPGHEPWALAPRSMGWQGLSMGEVCRAMKDPSKNGGRTLEAVHEHHAEDGLVGWAWHPGEGRTPAPGDHATFGALTQAWIDAGASCTTN